MRSSVIATFCSRKYFGPTIILANLRHWPYYINAIIGLCKSIHGLHNEHSDLLQDVCCSDGLSCCPRCSICDLVNRKCVSGFQRSDWASLTPSEPSIMTALVKIPANEVTVSQSTEQQ